ncbi:hypothetical protein JG687_00017939 [Phytophthora cactorum]|uniref:Uncharacterized protein n=1 Tax=Phytophthora cactorum TaxID=29920 RepID=A0A8T1TQU9_9STRA|nr:hypothetical protein JG687_00017939 [Phytophthora cactorum]
MPSPFETTLRRECTINGIPRCIPLGTFCRFQALATTNHVPFPVNRIAEHGVVPHWCCPLKRVGVRLVPQSYPSAEKGSVVVTHRLVAKYYRGSRRSLRTIPVRSRWPRRRTSQFRTTVASFITYRLHRETRPTMLSIRFGHPDARWDPYSSITQHVLELRRWYPDHIIYALGADIAEAVLHVSVHSRPASAFGGTIPRSQTGIVSGTAILGGQLRLDTLRCLGKPSDITSDLDHHTLASTSFAKIPKLNPTSSRPSEICSGASGTDYSPAYAFKW